MQREDENYLRRISGSFGALYRCLERPRIAGRTVFVLLAIHTGLLAYSAYVHSPTLNEPGHLVAGLSHWEFGRFELYRVNPPLVRMVAALPVMAVGYEEDWSGFNDEAGARPVFRMGIDFVRANGERSFFLFMVARWACIPFSWLGAIVCYAWAKDLYGRPAGVLACTLWCFSPNILAHASLITADAGGTALGVAACYTFWRWLKKPTWTQAALTGCVLGLAELAKTTLILFYPLWPLLWIAYRWSDRHAMIRQDWLREAGMLLLRMAIGLYVLNLGYGFEGSGKQLKKSHFVSSLFTGEGETTSAQQLAPNASPTNRFANTWLGSIPVPFPENYLQGIDVQQRDFEHYGHPSYLRGHWQDHGWWYYYLYAAAIKIPLGTWILAGMAMTMRIISRRKALTPNSLSTIQAPRLRDEIILLFPALLIFIVVSSKTGFSEHFRYVLPCFPFAFIFIIRFTPNASNINQNLLDTSGQCGRNDHCASTGTPKLFTSFATLILLLWITLSSLWIYPHSLSYFNESIRGPKNGHKHLLGSSADWGQDLLYLRRWMDSHPEIRPLYLAYHGNFAPSGVGFFEALPWQGEFTTGADAQEVDQHVGAEEFGLRSGGYAISVSFLEGSSKAARDGAKSTNDTRYVAFAEARDMKLAAKAGYSIWVFREK